MPRKDAGPRMNSDITAEKVRFVGPDGEMVGVVSLQEALSQAEDAGLDLVEISPQAEPPVCKALDYGKFKYEQQKKANEARKKQKTIEVKELKMRPSIDSHDLETKLRAANKFLDAGDKVKFTIRFRGRELAHTNRGRDVLNGIKDALGEKVKVEVPAKMEGRQMMMIVAPAKA